MESYGAALSRSGGNMNYTEAGMMDRHTFVRQRTVAIIEDEKDIAEVYARICESAGLRIVFIAYDGLEGLEAFKRSERPDVILLDHRMPQMTGLEAMKRILDIDPCARFIVLSADEVVRDEALETGASAFLKKPASLAEICRTLERVLNQH